MKMDTGNKVFVLWLTGLSGAGKSTIADRVFDEIANGSRQVEKLDGDIMRGYFPSTGFTKEARDEHIKRVGFMASRLESHGVIVIASFISPYRESRRFVRGICDNFIEVHVCASLEECEKRDVKGLYKKARAGEIDNFTGIDAPYEVPEKAEIVIDTNEQTVEESVDKIMSYIQRYI
jgi:adenylylsulfate kinase